MVNKVGIHEKSEHQLQPQNTQKDFLFKEESYRIHGAVFEIYREIGAAL
jgi:hypothetical protein